MATYTMELRNLLDDGFKLFDFDYTFWKEEDKPRFEKAFTDFFFFREICDTPARFKHYLKSRLTLELQEFNRIYMSQNIEQRILDNYDVTEEFKRNVKGNNKTKGDSNGKLLESDTPVKKINIDTNDYVSRIAQNDSTANSETISDNNENWIRTMKGNVGVQTDADAVMKYESSLKNVDMLLFRKLDSLFIGLY